MKNLILLLMLLLSPAIAYGAQVKSYGFEDWGGTIETTPDYPFGSGYSQFCSDHAAMSEVVSAYDGHTPHGGSNMFLSNMGPTALSPSVPGITSAFTGNSYNQGYHGGAYCTQSQFDITAMTNILYVSMWVKISGWENTTADSKLKLLNFYNATTTDTTFYLLYQAGTGNPELALWSRSGTGSAYNYGRAVDIADGGWHKVALYADYNDGGAAYMWYDQPAPTFANAEVSASVPAGYSMPTIDTLYLSENWSANTPTGEAWVAIDDIEIWDSLPTSTGNPTVLITGPTTGSTYATSTTPLTTLAGTSSDDVSVSEVAWECPTCTPTGGTAIGTTSWSVASIGLASGVNIITVTATDGDTNTGNDILTVTYTPPTGPTTPLRAGARIDPLGRELVTAGSTPIN